MRSESVKARRFPPGRKQALPRRRRKLVSEGPQGVSPALVARLQRRRRIAEAAYFLAGRRGSAPGSELDDWLEAESMLRADGWVESSP